ncbi:signal peptide peptidase SppA [Enterovirga sp.]|uniref:signal peptide peptidase SppA n=1 Tax=Enterovirga sp. TaxID=2026350 RepID=UPI0026334417|nr:signal peptide peptidase SppA [Enterovirga sp.]MDB5592911.1 signal peptide peptidase SppA, type [Enterovirga sp.]
MIADAEMIADRRRLRRKLTLWRVLAFGALLVAVGTAGLVATRHSGAFTSGQQIARISVSGLIAGDQRMSELLRRVGETGSVAGVVVSISSPGGTTTGSEELFRGIRALAARKPTVAFVDGTAASGAYITALGADRIVARETSLIGSIGVLFQYPDLSKLLATVGVAVEEVKSSPLKAEPSPFRPASPEARAALQSVVDDTYSWFRDLVRTRRNMSEAEARLVSDGRVFSARQALPLKLVDQLGSEQDAIEWLERERQVPRGLPVTDWKPRGPSTFSLWTAAAFGADLFGLDRAAATLRTAAGAVSAAELTGLLALWQPGRSVDR